MQLPFFQSDNQVLQLLQTKWRGILNPVLGIPFLDGIQLTGVSLINGVTVINHTLDRMQQGWFITDINGAATIYRSSGLNDKTLTLTSNAAVTVAVWVY